MYLPGHLGVTLLLLAPLVIVLGERTGVAFSLLAAPFSMLPDVDLALPGVHHHGATHTLAFAVGAALVIGAALTAIYLLFDVERRWLRRNHGFREVFGFATGAVLLPALGHVGLDLLSAPDIAQPLEPLWPIFANKVVSLDLLPVNSDLWNFGLLAVGAIVWIGAYLAVRSDDQASKSVSEV